MRILGIRERFPSGAHLKPELTFKGGEDGIISKVA